MNAVRVLYHLARADFYERTRRYSFLVMLGLVVLVGYIMVSGQMRLSVSPSYLGVTDSAWVGATMSITTSIVLGLVGFYIVKGSVARDYTTGVGQIMATTPISRPLYLLGKWLSNCAVLGITLVIVALAGIGMNLWLGAGGLRLVPLLAPLVLIGMPWLAFVAALAVLFESIAWLRGGLGNILYAVLWLSLLIVWTLVSFGALDPYLDFAGVRLLTDSVTASARAVYADAGGFGFGTGLLVGNPQYFTYPGIHWTGALLAARLLPLVLGGALVMLSAVFFDRFDPARLLRVKRGTAAAEPAPAPAASMPVSVVHLTPLRQGAAPHFLFRALLAAELKLLLKGQRWWWYVVAAGLVVAQLATPPDAVPYFLILAWAWPALTLSGLGCRENRFDTRQIVFAAPRPMTQLPAAWLSALLVMALLGSGALIRFLLAGDLIAALGWLTATVFIPSLALALGTLTGSGKVFEALYVLWLYCLMQRVAPIDFAGLAPGSRFYVFGPVAIGLLAIAALARWRQLQAR